MGADRSSRRAWTAAVGERRRVMLPGLVLGLGTGGFVDGIALHQILQWHHMRTGDGALGERSAGTVAGLEANTLADGLFHLATLVLTIVGIFLLSSRSREPGGDPRWELAGWMLAGWGAFNLVEGLVDHHVLGVHHVRDDVGAPLGWDLAFLASGAVLVAAGVVLARQARGGRLRG